MERGEGKRGGGREGRRRERGEGEREEGGEERERENQAAEGWMPQTECIYPLCIVLTDATRFLDHR